MSLLLDFAGSAAPVLFLLALALPLNCGLLGRGFVLALLFGWGFFILPFVIHDQLIPVVPEDYWPGPRLITKVGALIGWLPACLLFLLGRLGRRLLRLKGTTAGWGTFVGVLALLVAFLWWPGVRIYYYQWIKTTGREWASHTDFSQLARVLPPADATLTTVHSGLPHQMWQSDELWRDLFTTGNFSVGGYRFYSTPVEVPAELKEKISNTLRSPGLYRQYGGPKLCGGYHPDFCFEWESSQGDFLLLLCEGCHEIRLIGNAATLHCDLKNEPAKELENLLQGLRPIMAAGD